MSYIFKSAGLYGWPLLILTIVVVALAIVQGAQVFGRRRPGSLGIHAILFWGGVSAVLGILGQCHGIYNAMGAISQAREISPQIVAMGYGQSLSTTLWGLTLFLFSAVVWFVLVARTQGARTDLAG